jgi:hypothetical protein
VAAVCPHPPLLVTAGAGAPPAVIELLAACDAAVRTLLSVHPDVVAVVGDAPHAFEADATAVGSLAAYGLGCRAGAAITGAENADAAPRELPLSGTLGAWLLDRAGWSGARTYVGVPGTASAAAAAALGERLVTDDRRVALLVMGDGSARRSEQAPGYLDTRAAPFDATVAAALAGADTETLLGLDATLARHLLVAGRASWQVLAGACDAATAGNGASGWRGRILADVCPFGVGYLVAVLEPAG